MNYYTTAIEGLPKMLFEMEKPLESFKRNVYPGEFENTARGIRLFWKR